ncbi:MAG: AbiV family abortive infection protein [Candidatus Heimdallarchaeota archaeon]|nr:AbiV family abortive infection protein [Candidatus Heimdallarchaeota archaeon]
MNERRYEFYLEIGKISLENAKRFFQEAELLRENNSLGHAYSMNILGFEELTKIWGAIFLFLDFHSESDKEIIEIFSRKHELKHLIGKEIITVLVIQIIDLLIEKTGYEIRVPKIENLDKNNVEKYYKEYRELIVKLSKDTKYPKEAEIAKGILEIDELFEKVRNKNSILNERKNNGLYVDLNLKTKKIINNPIEFMIKEDSFIKFSKLTQEMTEYIFTGIIDNIDDREFNEKLISLRKNISKTKEFIRKLNPSK